MQQMTLIAFLRHVGLFVANQDKASDLKALTEDDRQFFVDRARIEYGIEIVRPKAA